MKTRICILIGVGTASLIIGITLIMAVEADQNPGITTLFDAFWWWIVTSTTVGYGDVVPITKTGKVIAIFSIIIGFYLYTNVVAIIAESVHNFFERHNKGTAQINEKNHILICEYTAMADELIQNLPKIPELANFKVVVATDLVQQNPYPENLFVSGVPINPATLKRANCDSAKMVFIFANFRFADPDVKTLHIASRVKDQNPDVPVFVEMVEEDSSLLKHAPDDLIVIPSRQVMEHVLQHVPFNPLEWLDEEQRKEILSVKFKKRKRRKS